MPESVKEQLTKLMNDAYQQLKKNPDSINEVVSNYLNVSEKICDCKKVREKGNLIKYCRCA